MTGAAANDAGSRIDDGADGSRHACQQVPKRTRSTSASACQCASASSLMQRHCMVVDWLSGDGVELASCTSDWNKWRWQSLGWLPWHCVRRLRSVVAALLESVWRRCIWLGNGHMANRAALATMALHMRRPCVSLARLRLLLCAVDDQTTVVQVVECAANRPRQLRAQRASGRSIRSCWWFRLTPCLTRSLYKCWKIK